MKPLFPASILSLVKQNLLKKKTLLEKRKEELEKEDPFADPERLVDNAAIDAEAAEQFGHANVAALKTEIDKTLIRIRKALTSIRVGNYGRCELCQKMIETKRLTINPTASSCIACEKKRSHPVA